MDKQAENFHTFFTTPMFAMGQSLPKEYKCGCGLMVNETATRARAGLLNMLSAITIFLLIAYPELDPVIYVGSFVIFDMAAAALFGLTPLSPVGLVGTTMTMNIRPVWKPTKPKRFAWTLGASLAIVCLTLRLFDADVVWLISVVSICFVLTWLEAVLGFCVGCWMHSIFFKCEVCALQ